MPEKHMLNIYNPTNKQAEQIEVSEAVYNEYRRGGWKIENNDRRFRRRETSFTDLKGGINGAYENFDEFRSEEDNPALLVVEKLFLQNLQQVLSDLTDDERELLHAFFFEGKSERRVAAEMDMPRMTIRDRKAKLLRKMRKILEN